MFDMDFKNQTAGYSLIEVLVSVSILLVAIVGPMTIASKGLSNAQFAREQTSAYFLAQEGLEIIVALRNDAGLEHVDCLVSGSCSAEAWDWENATIPATCKSATGCGVHFTAINTLSFVDCADDGGTACQLYYDETSARSQFSHDSAGAVSPYTRTLYLDFDGSENIVLVRSVVTWQANAFTTQREVELQTQLHDIYDFN